MTARLFTDEQEREIVASYEAGESYTDIARRLGVNNVTIRNVVRRNGGAMRRQAPRLTPDREGQILRAYLSGVAISRIATELSVARATVFDVAARNGAPRRDRSGPGGANWGGGRRRRGDGYIGVWVSSEDPMACMRRHGNYVLEHRLVMARHLGRPLREDETVHHINGNRSDNRLENLQLRQGHHGPHQAVGCLACGSHRIGPVKIASMPEWIDWTQVGAA